MRLLVLPYPDFSPHNRNLYYTENFKYNTALWCTLHRSKVHKSTVQRSGVHRGTVHRSTVLCIPVIKFATF